MNRPAGRRGVALALVLWLVIALSALAIAVVGDARSSSATVLNARARTISRYAAESGIVAATAMVERQLSRALIPAEQVTALRQAETELSRLEEMPLGVARFSVALSSLTGRLDLNEADSESLLGLLSQFVAPARALAILAALRDWRDADNLVRPGGAEKDTYRRLGSPFVPRNAPLRHVDEFRRLHGVTDSLARAVAPYITVSGETQVDVNTAPEPVLAALPGIGRAGARTLIRRRDRRPFTSPFEAVAMLGPAAEALTPILTVVPSRVLLTSRGWSPGHPLTHEVQAAYEIQGHRLALMSWRERDL